MTAMHVISPPTSYVSARIGVQAGMVYLGEVPRCIQVTLSHPRGLDRGTVTFHFNYIPEDGDRPLYVTRNSPTHGNQHHVRRVPAEARAEADRLYAVFVAAYPLRTVRRAAA
jgi:hypothetical protein